LSHFERSEAESRNLLLIDFSTSSHFVATGRNDKGAHLNHN
jgi:hypothetical protein